MSMIRRTFQEIRRRPASVLPHLHKLEAVVAQHLPKPEVCPYSESSFLGYGCLALARTLRRTGTNISSSAAADNPQSDFLIFSHRREITDVTSVQALH